MTRSILFFFTLFLFSQCKTIEENLFVEQTDTPYFLYDDLQNVQNKINTELENGKSFWEICGSPYHKDYFIGLEYKGGTIVHTDSLKKEIWIATGGYINNAYPYSEFKRPSIVSKQVILDRNPNNTTEQDKPLLCDWAGSIPKTSSETSSGLANTLAIVNSCGDSWSFAQEAHNLTVGVYDDWFLPSSGELKIINSNISQMSVQYLSASYLDLGSITPSSSYTGTISNDDGISVFQSVALDGNTLRETAFFYGNNFVNEVVIWEIEMDRLVYLRVSKN